MTVWLDSIKNVNISPRQNFPLYGNWQGIHSLHSYSLLEVLDRHAEIFEEGVGTLKGYQAKIYIDRDATPRFFKARSVLYSMQSLVNKELDKLVNDGIIEPVRFAG